MARIRPPAQRNGSLARRRGRLRRRVANLLTTCDGMSGDDVLQCVAVCCSVLQCVAVCCSVLQCVAVCSSVQQCVAVFCSVQQYVAVCSSVLPKPRTMNPKPSILNSDSATHPENGEASCLEFLAPKPYTLNPKPKTLNPKP